MPDLRPMSDAPRDGTPILTRILGSYPAVVTYDAENPKGNEWRVSMLDAWFGTDTLDGWMPLPDDLLPNFT